MRLLTVADVAMDTKGRVFAHSQVRAALWALICSSVCVASIFVAIRGHRWLGWYFTGAALLLMILTWRFITAPFRPSNWLVRVNDQGLFIQFRSYLNYHLPVDDITVVFLTYEDVRSARLVIEHVRVRDTRGSRATQTLRYVELELIGDLDGLSKALVAESAERAPTEKRWYGTSSTLYQDHPASLSSPPFLRLRWQVVPRAKNFLDLLRTRTTVAELIQVSEDFAHLRGLPRDQQQQRLREIALQGNVVGAVYMARRLYGCGLEEAVSMVQPPTASTQVTARTARRSDA